MADEVNGIKLGDAIRQVASDQAQAYSKYSALLTRFAKREVDFLDFFRGSLDIYADGLRDLTQIGGKVANDTVKTGISKVQNLRGLNLTSIRETASKTIASKSTPVADAPAAKTRAAAGAKR